MLTVDVSILKESLNSLRYAHAALQKRAYTEMGAPAGPMLGGGGAPPMDPNAMPPGGAPPMDPNAMPPGGAPPMDPNAMPPMDPNAMPPGGAPPMDPNAMPPMDPNAMPPADPNAMPPGGAPPAGGISPELQQMLTQLADGMGEVATTSAEQQTAIDQLAKQQLQLEQRMQEIRDLLQGPLPADEGAAGEAPQQAPAAGGAVAALGQM